MSFIQIFLLAFIFVELVFAGHHHRQELDRSVFWGRVFILAVFFVVLSVAGFFN